MKIDFFERMGAEQRKGDSGQPMPFRNAVPSCQKVDILDAEYGWLCTKLLDFDILKYEHVVDSTEGYGTLDAIQSTPA